MLYLWWGCRGKFDILYWSSSNIAAVQRRVAFLKLPHTSIDWLAAWPITLHSESQNGYTVDSEAVKVFQYRIQSPLIEQFGAFHSLPAPCYFIGLPHLSVQHAISPHKPVLVTGWYWLPGNSYAVWGGLVDHAHVWWRFAWYWGKMKEVKKIKLLFERIGPCLVSCCVPWQDRAKPRQIEAAVWWLSRERWWQEQTMMRRT